MTDQIVIVENERTKVIEVSPQGIPGPQGPPGEPGGDTGRVTMTVTAGQDLGGHRAVYVSSGMAYYAGANDTDTAFRISGITTHASASFGDIQIMLAGPITEPSWSWDPLKPVFCGINGVLTQTITEDFHFLRIVGYPTGPDSLLVNIQDVIFI